MTTTTTTTTTPTSRVRSGWGYRVVEYAGVSVLYGVHVWFFVCKHVWPLLLWMHTHIFSHFPTQLNTFPCYASENPYGARAHVGECTACPCEGCVVCSWVGFYGRLMPREYCAGHIHVQVMYTPWKLQMRVPVLSVRIHESIKHAANADTRLLCRVCFGSTTSAASVTDGQTHTHVHFNSYANENIIQHKSSSNVTRIITQKNGPTTENKPHTCIQYTAQNPSRKQTHSIRSNNKRTCMSFNRKKKYRS